MNTQFKLLIITIFTICWMGQGKAQGFDYYLMPGGDVTNLADWNDDPGGAGSAPLSFVLSDNWYIINNTSVSLSTPWLLDGNASIYIGDGTSNVSFLLSTGAVTTASPNIIINSLGTLDLETNYSFNPSKVFPQTGSTVIYGVNSPNIMQFQNPYYNLTVDNNVNLSSIAIVVGGTLTINSGKTLTLNGNNLTVSSLITGSGLIDGGSANQSALTLNGSGGTLNFASGGQRLNSLTINLSSASNSVTLGTDFSISAGINPAFTLTQGKFNISSRLFSCSGTMTFGSNSSIMGNSASTMSLTGSGTAISGNMNMDASANTLGAFIFNKLSRSITLGNTLNITDAITITAGTLTTGGNLVIKSTSTLKGRIGAIGNNGTISGNATVETYVAGPSTGWAQWGSNGVSGLTVSNWANTIPATCQGCPNDVTAAGGYFESIQGYSEPNGANDTTITSATSLSSGTGFWVYVGSGQSSTTDYLLSYSGPVVQKTVNKACTVTPSVSATDRGYMLVANPYASPISWTAVRALSGTSNFASAIYVWNADASGGNGAYTSYVAGAGTSSGASGISDVIPVGQGFFVQALNAGNLTFNESVKTTSNSGSFPLLRTSSNPNGKMFRLAVKGTYGDQDDMVFRIHASASPAFDPEWDAHKLFSTPGYLGYPGSYSKYTTISSKDPSGEDYSIHSVPPVTQQNLHIPVLVRGMATGNYTIEASETEDIEECVMLIDKLTNTLHDLKSGSYTFHLNDTTSTPRFELVLCKGSAGAPVGVEEVTASSSIFISQDEQGAYVKTDFAQDTKATISVFNIIGQKLMNDIVIEGTITNTHLNLDHNQVVLIRVATEKEVSTKKLITH